MPEAPLENFLCQLAGKGYRKKCQMDLWLVKGTNSFGAAVVRSEHLPPLNPPINLIVTDIALKKLITRLINYLS